MAQCFSRCLTVTYFGGSWSFKLSCYHSLKFPSIISDVFLPLMGSFIVVLGVPLPLIGIELCHTKLAIATQWGGSVSFQVFDCWWLLLVCIVLGISMPLTRVSLHHSWFPTFVHWSLSFQVFHWCSLKWLRFILFFSPLLTMITLCCPRCFTTVSCGRCVSFQVYHYFSLEWISMVPFLFQCCLLGWLCCILVSQCHLTKLFFWSYVSCYCIGGCSVLFWFCDRC